MVLHINPIIEYHISPKDLVQSDLRRHQCMHQYIYGTLWSGIDQPENFTESLSHLRSRLESHALHWTPWRWMLRFLEISAIAWPLMIVWIPPWARNEQIQYSTMISRRDGLSISYSLAENQWFTSYFAGEKKSCFSFWLFSTSNANKPTKIQRINITYYFKVKIHGNWWQFCTQISGFPVSMFPNKQILGTTLTKSRKSGSGVQASPPNKEQTAKMENKKLRNQVNFVVCSGL